VALSFLPAADSSKWEPSPTADGQPGQAGPVLNLQSPAAEVSCVGLTWWSYAVSSERETRIEERAYALWEAEGHPHGRHEEHWHRAAREIAAEETASNAAQARSRRSPRRASRKRT